MRDYPEIGVIRQFIFALCANRFAHNAKSFDNLRMEIGKIIRALRQERSETLEQLALEVGTDASNLSRIERGVQQASKELLAAIAASLNTSVSSLYASAEGKQAQNHPTVTDVVDESDFTSAAIQLRKHFRSLTPDNQRLAVELLKLLQRTQVGK